MSKVPPQTVRFELGGGRVLREEVCPLVGELPVAQLDLCGCFLGIFEWTTLCRTWERNRHLRRLVLRRTNLDADCAKEVAQLLANNRRLRLLDVSNNRLGDAGAETLAHGLAANRALTALDARQNGLTAAGGRALLAAALVAVRTRAPLRLVSGVPVKELMADAVEGGRLLLNRQRLGAAEAALLAGLLPAAYSLSTLLLKDNQLGADAAHLLGVELARPGCSLLLLDVSLNSLGDAGARQLARGLRANRTLRELRLVGAAIGGKGRQALGEGLLANPASALACVSTDLWSIGPGDTQVCVPHAGLAGCDGALLFAPLRRNEHVTAVDASYNQLGDEGAAAAATALGSARFLRHLDLSDNAIGARGVRALARALAPDGGAFDLGARSDLDPDLNPGGSGVWLGDGLLVREQRANSSVTPPLAAMCELGAEEVEEAEAEEARCRRRSCSTAAQGTAKQHWAELGGQRGGGGGGTRLGLGVGGAGEGGGRGGGGMRPALRRGGMHGGMPKTARTESQGMPDHGTAGDALSHCLFRAASVPQLDEGHPAHRASDGGPAMLETLLLGSNRLPAATVPVLCAAIADGRVCRLQRVSLAGTSIADDAARYVALMVRLCGSLRNLDLAYCNLSDAAVAQLADALAGNRTLTQLDMQGNECSDFGRWALARALDSNNESALVFLSDNRWALQQDKAELALSDAKLTDADAGLLCAALRFNCVATSLRLCQNRFT
ncbi:hypothetical protein T492DRAFT_1106507, partial [Pavlovales sp. CCMP2436]